MPITGGFGFAFDLTTGRTRRWYMGRDGVKRWMDNDEPCEQQPAATGEKAWAPPKT